MCVDSRYEIFLFDVGEEVQKNMTLKLSGWQNEDKNIFSHFTNARSI